MKTLFGIFSFVLIFGIVSGIIIATNGTYYSKACQETDKKCSVDISQYNTTNECSFLKENMTFSCYVQRGFCKENEFSNLTAKVCNTSMAITNNSNAKNNFYTAIANLSATCQVRVVNSVDYSVIFMVFKAQEQFCALMNTVSWESYLTTNCTTMEFQNLKNATCNNNDTNVNQNFSQAILSSSMSCQSQISICANPNATNATIFAKSGQYCELVKSFDRGVDIESCFKNNCTETEISKIKVAACGEAIATSPAPNTVSTVSTVTTTNVGGSLASSTFLFVILSLFFPMFFKS